MESNNGNENVLTPIFLLLFALAFSIFLLVCRWKIFVKAGKEGWKSIIPIYNIIILIEIVKKPTWWIFLLLIPIYNIYIMFTLNIRLSKSFGKNELFGILLTFFNFIFEPILAFSDAKYNSETISDDQNSNSWS